MALETELAYFNQHRAEWCEDGREGEWVVVHGTELLGMFATLEEAFNSGAENFAPDLFLVKQITLKDPVEYLSRVFNVA